MRKIYGFLKTVLYKIKSLPKLQKVNGKIEMKECSKFLKAYMMFKFKKTP